MTARRSIPKDISGLARLVLLLRAHGAAVSRPVTIEFAVDRDGAEVGLTIEAGHYSRAVRGRTCAAPEDCFPGEPADVEIGRIHREGVDWDDELSENEREEAKDLLLAACADEDAARWEAAGDAEYDLRREGGGRR